MIKENKYRLGKTGIPALDALVDDKFESASANDIQMRCRLEVPAELFVKDEDLCCILGNLLDNALEAVQKLPEEERRVSLIVRLTKGTVYISVRNHYREESVTDGRCKFQSSKVENQDSRLSVVEQIAEKYYGDVSIAHEEGVFRVSVLLLQKEIIH